MSLLERELTELYDEASQQLFRCALAVTRSADLAEDAVHDAFIRSFRLKDRPDHLRAYMFRAVRNAAVDIVRRQSKTVQPTTDDFFELTADPAAAPAFGLEEIIKAMTSLSDDERETVLQHLAAGLTFREISEVRARPIGTIATWYRRGLEKIRQKMNTEDRGRDD